MRVLFRNLLQGPSTDPFPAGETFTPERLRGKPVIDPDLCMGCGVCKSVCAGGAIDISPKEDQSGYTITVWHNTCCHCASCRHFCPTGAMSLNNNWHTTHDASEKYNLVEQHTINYEPCARCGAMIRPLPAKLAEKLYKSNPDVDPEQVRHLCPKCRQLDDAHRVENKKPVPEAVEAAQDAGKNVEISSEHEEKETVKAERNN